VFTSAQCKQKIQEDLGEQVLILLPLDVATRIRVEWDFEAAAGHHWG
jgi:hypothetical protein